MNKKLIVLVTVTVLEGIGLSFLLGALGLLSTLVLLPINAIIIGTFEAKKPKSRPTTKPQTTNKEENLVIEDSQGDGLMSEGDIMFPEEDED